MITVIIPMYNAETSISIVLNSLLNQTYKDYEIIVIDDASMDNSLDIVENFFLQNKEIKHKIIKSNKNGVGISRNIGIESSNGEYIVFVDADDELETNYLLKLYLGINRSGIDLCYGGYNRVIGNNKYEIFDINSGVITIDQFISSFYCYKTIITIWNSIFKSSIIKKNNIQFSTLHFGEDVEFISKYILYCDNVNILHDIIYNYNCSITKYYNRETSDITINPTETFYYKMITEVENSKYKKYVENIKKSYFVVETVKQLQRIAFSCEYNEFRKFILGKNGREHIKSLENFEKWNLNTKKYIYMQLNIITSKHAPLLFYIMSKVIAKIRIIKK